jgi:hypothetical protein
VRVLWRAFAAGRPEFQHLMHHLQDFIGEPVQLFLSLPEENLFLPVGALSDHAVSLDGRFRAYETKLGWTISGPLGAPDGPAAVPPTTLAHLLD